MNITNKGNIPLGLAVWALHDDYDYIDHPNYISATRLMKPLRHIILPPRVPKGLIQPDVEDYVSRALGSALHSSVENAWHKSHQKALKMLGYPQSMIDRVLINPTTAQLTSIHNPIPVYIEQRAFKQITVNGVTYVIGGKFDMVTEGIVTDNKSTTSFTWVHGTKDDDYALQGSIYRWLNTDAYEDVECTIPIGVNRITEDFIRINFIFTDWQKVAAKTNPNYPQSRLQSKDVPLMSLQETENYIRRKLTEVQNYKDKPETEVPECTDEELWRSAPQYKYYSDPNNTAGRSTKNFDSPSEAKLHLASKGKGTVIAVPGEVKRCGYCEAFPVCTQKDRYFP